MRFRRWNVVFGAALVFSGFIALYLVVSPMGIDEGEQEEIQILQIKLGNLENEIFSNQRLISEIEHTLNALNKEQRAGKNARVGKIVIKTSAVVSRRDTGFAASAPSVCDIRMSEVYDKLKFDNPDGGVWKQGWDVRYDENEVKKPENKLRVFVVPHSHNDPGWIKTFEEYYRTQTSSILSNAVVKLSLDKRRKFVWAEISYLALWWSEQTPETREKFKNLVSNGQLEIVTGGWVMPDEANSHYYSILEQLMLGQEWCSHNLDNFKPNNGWSIDPFGMSPTMAYFLKRSGFDNMVIQRTHYSVKKFLASTRDLEFRWRQHWDHDDSSEILTHMMPFYSYDVPHTCGPDPKVCCQFDFLRLPGGRAFCPWKKSPKVITKANVANRSVLLLDQYRKKAELFKTRSLLVPLGDDFRYDTSKEWDSQFENYQMIFDHVNSHPELNAELSFGTLQDYFNHVRKESKSKTKSEQGLFKSLSGDFFTYSDREDHYWSGYYTSRPFYKNLDRVLTGYLRSAEILYSIAWAEMEYMGTDLADMMNPFLLRLYNARQSLSLFQHHDGVTGTAKTHVMDDYGKKMLSAIYSTQEVMAGCAHYLLSSTKVTYDPQHYTKFFQIDDLRESHHSMPKQIVIQIDAPVRLVLFNSHSRHRSELVSVRISEPNVRVYRMNRVDGEKEQETIPSQLSPVFDYEGQIMNNEFKLTFLVQANGLALTTYIIAASELEEYDNRDVATVRIFNFDKRLYQVPPFSDPHVLEKGENFTLENGYVTAHFNRDGILQAMTTIDDGLTTQMKMEFVAYGTKKSGDSMSGAYLFLPDGKAKILPIDSPVVRIVEGKILSYVEVLLPWVTHAVIVNVSPGQDGTGIQVHNDVHIEHMDNKEVAMRLSTNIDSKDEFVTDLNAFHMMKRKRLDKLPLQANFYPVPSMAYIQDDKSRLTLVSKQPLGGSSLRSGELEIMLDRRLIQDDNRGLQQGVTDNLATPHVFYILLERHMVGCSENEVNDSSGVSYPSLTALHVRHSLINPMHRMIPTRSGESPMTDSYEQMEQESSCDIDLINLRTGQKKGSSSMTPSNRIVLVVHRQGFNACYKAAGLTCSTDSGKIRVANMFPTLFADKMKQTSTTTMWDGVEIDKSFTLSIKPMELYSFILSR